MRFQLIFDQHQLKIKQRAFYTRQQVNFFIIIYDHHANDNSSFVLLL